MLSVIIPVLDEARSIGDVVAFVRRSPLVGEVLVIDDGSIDGSAEIAAAAGARVLTSSLLGKGASMEDGVRAAQHELVLFLDGDLVGLDPALVERMAAPLLRGEADFVKARFTRAAGRVTTLTARPLLRIFFPEVASLTQPLGGIVAARRSLLASLPWESDYGVDVGILLDATAAGARVLEVDVGHLEHDSQPLDRLADMARQVVRVIVDRAARHGRLDARGLHEIEEVERQAAAELTHATARIGRPEGLALLDMDGTLVRARFAEALAAETGRTDALGALLDADDIEPAERTRRIAALFAGVPRSVFETVARSMPLVDGARELVVALRTQGYRVGLVSDSFFIATEVVRRRVFADFSIAHVLRFRDRVATGDVTIAAAMHHPDGCAIHAICKRNVLLHLTRQLHLPPAAVVAVGDGLPDACLLTAAGIGLAFEPKHPELVAAADAVVTDDLRSVLAYLPQPVAVA